MTKKYNILIISAFCVIVNLNAQKIKLCNLNKSVEIASVHAIKMAESLQNDPNLLPKSIDIKSKLQTSDSGWWCSGFFPGVLWYLYEYTNKPELKYWAEIYTDRVEKEKYTTDNHDIGFILNCSFGNGFRLTGNQHYKEVLAFGAESLSSRFNDKIGLIRSWDFNQNIWQYPVIIDNLMNLEFLEWGSKNSGVPLFDKIARSHADKTMLNHFRPDYSCFHLVSYDTLTTEVQKKQTWQGYNDSSSWARGQGWALYGYTMMYRETKDVRYLHFAENIANYILFHPNLPKDKIPYWDFNAPNIPHALRDASAGAVIASALIELSQMTVNKEFSKEYLKTAIIQINTLSSPKYLAKPNTNGNFILKHSVGFFSKNSEIDVPVTYADYYYIEALVRLRKVMNVNDSFAIKNNFK